MSTLKLQCCGMLEEACGSFERELKVSGFPIRVQEALTQFAEANPAAREYLPYVACAVRDEIVVRNHTLNEGDTLVLLPPVSGG
ncbi:MAG TPA: MoaD/ThiS family protein [Gammaproteobacteria bacterium]|nr:MoaD/ThiS family protein [Gammaproteobacteria bacterium]